MKSAEKVCCIPISTHMQTGLVTNHVTTSIRAQFAVLTSLRSTLSKVAVLLPVINCEICLLVEKMIAFLIL